MKCRIIFSRKNKKYISECCWLKFLPSMHYSWLFIDLRKGIENKGVENNEDREIP